METNKGALVFAHERQGVRYLTLGFDPLPYLGRSNLPMSIFTLNLLDWFFASSGAQTQATGEPIPLGTSRGDDVVVTPKAQKIALPGGQNYFSGTYFQGIYQVTRGRDRQIFSRNLQDAASPTCALRRPLRFRVQP